MPARTLLIDGPARGRSPAFIAESFVVDLCPQSLRSVGRAFQHQRFLHADRGTLTVIFAAVDANWRGRFLFNGRFLLRRRLRGGRQGNQKNKARQQSADHSSILARPGDFKKATGAKSSRKTLRTYRQLKSLHPARRVSAGPDARFSATWSAGSRCLSRSGMPCRPAPPRVPCNNPRASWIRTAS